MTEERVTTCPICELPVIVKDTDRFEDDPDTAEFYCQCGAMGTVDWTQLPPRLRDVSND